MKTDAQFVFANAPMVLFICLTVLFDQFALTSRTISAQDVKPDAFGNTDSNQIDLRPDEILMDNDFGHFLKEGEAMLAEPRSSGINSYLRLSIRHRHTLEEITMLVRNQTISEVTWRSTSPQICGTPTNAKIVATQQRINLSALISVNQQINLLKESAIKEAFTRERDDKTYYLDAPIVNFRSFNNGELIKIDRQFAYTGNKPPWATGMQKFMAAVEKLFGKQLWSKDFHIKQE